MPRPSDGQLEQRLAGLAQAGAPPEGFLERVRARRRAVVARRVAGAAAVVAAVCVAGVVVGWPRSPVHKPAPQPRYADERGSGAHRPETAPGGRGVDSLVGLRQAWEEDGADWLASLDARVASQEPVEAMRFGDSTRFLAGGL